MSQSILFLFILGFCFTQNIDICSIEFKNRVENKCQDIDSSACSLIPYSYVCFSKTNNNACSKGDGNDNDCAKIIPYDFPTHKCQYDYVENKCKPQYTSCNDYNNYLTDYQIDFTGYKDLCPKFHEEDTTRQCRLNENGECTSFSKVCTGLSGMICTNNIISNTTKCNLVNGNCVEGKRPCETPDVTEEQCYNNLEPTGDDASKKSCVYSDGKCKEAYISCIDISSPGRSSCNTYPLSRSENHYEFDFTNKCFLTQTVTTGGITNNICGSKPVYCTDYDGSVESICLKHKAKDSDKRCVYDPTRTSNKCYEEYKECELYTSKKIQTDRAGCEGIILLEENKKCIYSTEEDKCFTNTTLIYSECDDYKENSKKICESIVLYPTDRQYCIFDKDSKCKERPLTCSEAIDSEECLNIAKATDENKRCAYKHKKCYEEYIRCEDFIENNQGSGSSDCERIKLYNGFKCKEESTMTVSNSISTVTKRCRTEYKTCEGYGLEITEEECKLIAKTGVSDPERKVCDYLENSEIYGTLNPKRCIENYKYCSDYRGGKREICEQIKPYNEEGDKIDVRFKCKYESDIGCQRIPVECDNAKNPLECKLFSDYIKDHEKKYCTYFGGQCKEFYKNCEDVDIMNKCSSNVIEGYLFGVCGTNENGDKCEKKKDCSLFKEPSSTSNDNYYKDLCESINPNCTYTTDECKYEEKSCDDIKFYPEYTTDDEKKKDICEQMQASERYKKCVLEEDKSGCKEVYRELTFSSSHYSSSNTPESIPQEESSDFIKKGIPLILLLFGFLI